MTLLVTFHFSQLFSSQKSPRKKVLKTLPGYVCPKCYNNFLKSNKLCRLFLLKWFTGGVESSFHNSARNILLRSQEPTKNYQVSLLFSESNSRWIQCKWQIYQQTFWWNSWNFYGKFVQIIRDYNFTSFPKKTPSKLSSGLVESSFHVSAQPFLQKTRIGFAYNPKTEKFFCFA